MPTPKSTFNKHELRLHALQIALSLNTTVRTAAQFLADVKLIEAYLLNDAE